MPTTSMTPMRVADLAERYLGRYQPTDYRIVADRTAVRVDAQGWWEVAIRPSRPHAPTFDWIGRSSTAAVDMDEAERVHVPFM